MIDIREHGTSFGGDIKMLGEWEDVLVTADNILSTGQPVTVKTTSSLSLPVAKEKSIMSRNYGWHTSSIRVKLNDNKYIVFTGSVGNFVSWNANIVTINESGVPIDLTATNIFYGRLLNVTRISPTKLFLLCAKELVNQNNQGIGIILDFTNDVITKVYEAQINYSGIKHGALIPFEQQQKAVFFAGHGNYDIGYSDTIRLSYTDFTFNSDFTSFSEGVRTTIVNSTGTHIMNLVDIFRTHENKAVYISERFVFTFSFNGESVVYDGQQTISQNAYLSNHHHIETIGDIRVLFGDDGIATLEQVDGVWTYSKLTVRDDFKNTTLGYSVGSGMVNPFRYVDAKFDRKNNESPFVKVIDNGLYLIGTLHSASNTGRVGVALFCLGLGTLKKGVFMPPQSFYGVNIMGLSLYVQNGLLTIIMNEYENNLRYVYYQVFNLQASVLHEAKKMNSNTDFVGIAKSNANIGEKIKITHLKKY